MATSKVRDIAVDPRFFVPSGVIDVRQANQEDGAYYYDETTIADEGPILESPESRIPMPPSSYTITEQRVRTASDGRAVVDVYIDFPDTDGTNTIDVRVTKT